MKRYVVDANHPIFNTPKQPNNSIRAMAKVSDKPENMTIEEYRVDLEKQLRSKYKTDEHTLITITIVDK